LVRALTPITFDDLRRLAVAQSLFPPTTLKRALHGLGFVQADPIRAPARAQDLILRHRVKNYRAGDLERRYSKLGVEEDFFINYGFVTSAIHALMHPRLAAVPKPGEQYKDPTRISWPAERMKKAEALLEFIRERGSAHPREVDDHFSHGTVRNYWGGSSNATTHLLDAMHYSGLLRVMRREDGIRIYAAREHAVARPSMTSRLISSAEMQAMKPHQRRRLADHAPSDNDVRRAQIDTLVDVAVRIYAPLPSASLSIVVNRLRFAVPQWHNELKSALQRAKQRLSHTQLDGIDWYWPATRDMPRDAPHDAVRLLTPFDPVVWDRARFEILWGWTYRFEAYTPVAKRKRGYYALPILWRNHVIGWANLSVKNGELTSEFGYIKSPPRDRTYKRELDVELSRMRTFLDLEP
jgi:uncharacterized protein YcaQ